MPPVAWLSPIMISRSADVQRMVMATVRCDAVLAATRQGTECICKAQAQ